MGFRGLGFRVQGLGALDMRPLAVKGFIPLRVDTGESQDRAGRIYRLV